MLPFHKILCPTDFSASSRAAMHKAGELAAHFNSELCVLHVTPLVPALTAEFGDEIFHVAEYQSLALAEAEKLALELVETCVPKGVVVKPLIRLGNDAASKIVDIAQGENTDLIVIATHGVTGWRHMVFGSVTERLLHLAKCPVLVIQAPLK